MVPLQDKFDPSKVKAASPCIADEFVAVMIRLLTPFVKVTPPPPPPPEIVIVLVAPVPDATTPLPTKFNVVADVDNALPSS